MAFCSPVTTILDLVCTGISSTPLYSCQNLLKPSRSTAMELSANAPYSSTKNGLSIVKRLSHVEPRTERVLQHLRGYPPAPVAKPPAQAILDCRSKTPGFMSMGFIFFFHNVTYLWFKACFEEGAKPMSDIVIMHEGDEWPLIKPLGLTRSGLLEVSKLCADGRITRGC